MALSIAIDIETDNIVLREPGMNFQFQCANIIAIDTSSQKIVEVGKFGDEIERKSPEAWRQIQSRISFEKIYDPDNFHPQNLLPVLWYLVTKAREAKYSSILLRIMHSNHRDTLALSLPSYENVDQQNRRLFELQIPDITRTKAVIINGTPIELYHFHRALVSWTIKLFITGGTVLGVYVATFLLPVGVLFNRYQHNLVAVMVALAYLSMMALFGSFAGIIVWYPLSKKFIPPQLFTDLVITRKMVPRFILRLFKTATLESDFETVSKE